MAKPFEAYENLKEKLGEEQARAVIDYIDTATKQGLSTKEDIYGLQLDINKLERKIEEDIYGLQLDINKLERKIENEVNRLEIAVKEDISRLELKMEGVKTEVIKWMIGVGIGIVALLLSVLRFMGKP